MTTKKIVLGLFAVLIGGAIGTYGGRNAARMSVYDQCMIEKAHSYDSAPLWKVVRICTERMRNDS